MVLLRVCRERVPVQHGPRQLRGGDVAADAAVELAADYDLMDERGHWKFVPVNELKPGDPHNNPVRVLRALCGLID